jgi:hypothetical protein
MIDVTRRDFLLTAMAAAGAAPLADPCFLIHHPLLWDTGLADSYVGHHYTHRTVRSYLAANRLPPN